MTRLFLLVFCCLVATNVAYAGEIDAEHERAIDARTSDMQLRKFYLGPLFAMAKGDIPYNAELAAGFARSLQLLSELNMHGFWPEGSHSGAYPDKTAAKESAWLTYPEVTEYGKKYRATVDGLVPEAGLGLDQLRAKVGAVGKACKACHDEYREED
ncbi:MAG: cytochrome c [Gammaproteobacteria bacterium]|nr:cytochrome c [Gammaproteobacteria bacterium]